LALPAPTTIVPCDDVRTRCVETTVAVIVGHSASIAARKFA
jgi:hypothetical protein